MDDETIDNCIFLITGPLFLSLPLFSLSPYVVCFIGGIFVPNNDYALHHFLYIL